MNCFTPFFFTAMVVLDQVFKAEALKYGTIEIFKWLKIAPEANYGFAFSLFCNHGELGQLPFVFISMAVTIFMLYIFKNVPRTCASQIAKTLVVAGSISNIIDRIARGYVVDFISLTTFNLHWSVFNLADLFVVCGLLYLNYIEIAKE